MLAPAFVQGTVQARQVTKQAKRPPAADATPEQRREWGRRGGLRKAERERVRKVETDLGFSVTEVDDMRAFLNRLAAKLDGAHLDEAKSASAGAALVRTMLEVNGARADRIELERLRQAATTAAALASRMEWDTSLVAGGFRSIPAIVDVVAVPIAPAPTDAPAASVDVAPPQPASVVDAPAQAAPDVPAQPVAPAAPLPLLDRLRSRVGRQTGGTGQAPPNGGSKTHA